MGGGAPPFSPFGGGPFLTPSAVPDPNILRILELLTQQQREKDAEELVEIQLKVLSATFDKAVQYTNLVIVAGYGGFFGLWALTKEYLTPTGGRSAALWMLASGTISVAFEVFKMIGTGIVLIKWDKKFEDPEVKGDLKEIKKKLDERDKAFRRWNRSLIRAWWFQLVAALVTALVGVGVLYVTLVQGL